RAPVHAAGRAVRRRRSDRGARHPDHRRRPPPSRHRGADHRLQRRAHVRDRGSRLYHVRGRGARRRHRSRAGVQRPGRRALPRPDHDGAAPAPDGGGPMRPGLSQQTGLRQELRINPRLYQAMDMLYMPMMDLQQHLKQELLANPFLELLEPEEEDEGKESDEKEKEKEKEKQEKEQEIDWEEILLNGFDAGGSRPQYEAQEYLEPVCVETPDLIDHLRDQLRMMELDPRQRLLSEEFLGNIGDEGYLIAPVEELRNSVTLLLERHAGDAAAPAPGGDGDGDGEEPEGEDAAPAPADLLQPGPAWIGLPENGATAEAAARSAAAPAELPRPRPAGDIPGVPYYNDAEIEQMLGVIQRLDPAGVGARDLRECLRLQLSRSYQEIARDKKKLTPENREFIANKLNSANWMIQAIEQRRQTMLKVMNFIVDRQRAFFEKGVEYLKPLTLREVAEVISMHESTVSRVTNEKYVQTPRGVLPLKFFFSSALTTASGEDASARSIRAKLEKMV